MIFISENPKTDMLIIRDVPVIIAPISVGIGAVLFYAAEQNNEDLRTTATLFAIGVAVNGLALALARVKTLVLNGTERTLTLREPDCSDATKLSTTFQPQRKPRWSSQKIPMATIHIRPVWRTARRIVSNSTAGNLF